MTDAPEAGQSFGDLGVSKPVVAALAERGIETAFPIQTAVIQAALDGRDLCGKAPTGSGKTLAFGVPAIDLAEPGGPWHPKVLILSPTRELASQIKEELAELAKSRSRRIGTVYGGTNIERDIRMLERGVDILVACPGRLEDLIARRCCELRDVQVAIVDEADRMADMGFLPSVKRILDQTPDNRQTLLFSATLDGDVDALIERYQNDPLTYEVEADLDDLGDVEHSWYLQEPSARIDEAAEILRRFESTIVFCRTRRGCDRVTRMLTDRKIRAVAIHGNRSQAQRERALADFATGRADVLVATDVAARGIHVDNVALVMHYDPANSDKDYIHRSGRTGRAGNDGRVISLVVEDKKKIAKQLQKDLGVPREFEVVDLTTLPEVVERSAAPKVDDRDSKPNGKPPQNRDIGGQRSQGNDRGRGDRNRNDRNRDDRGGRGRGDRDDRGGYRGKSDRNERGDRGGYRGRNDRNERGDRNRGRNDRNERGDYRGKSDRNDRNERGNRNRDDRGGYRGKSDRNRDDRGGYRGKNDRNERGDRNRDDRGGYRGRNDRNDRDDRPRTNTRRHKKNDWYPPGWDDEERPAGGSDTTKRKSRSTKGRHADRDTNKNKGRPNRQGQRNGGSGKGGSGKGGRPGGSSGPKNKGPKKGGKPGSRNQGGKGGRSR